MDGGPIGDDATMVAAELVMFTFVFRYKERLMKLDIYCDLILLKVYVDDLNQVGKCLPVRTRYIAGKLFIPRST